MTHENDTPDSTPMVPRNGKTRVRKTPGMPPPQLGDYAQFGEKNQLYWNSIPPQFRMPPAKPVVVGPGSTTSTRTQEGYQVQSKWNFEAPPPPSKLPPDAPDSLIEISRKGIPIPVQNVSPDELLRQEVFIEETKARLGSEGNTTFSVQQPEQIVPPITATPINISTTAAGIPVVAGAFRTGVSFTVPNRWIAVVTRAGNGLENQAAFIDVNWRMRIGERNVGPNASNILSALDPFPTPVDGVFRNLIGSITDPTDLAVHIVVSQLQTFTFDAISLAGAHVGQMRIMGYMYPVQTTSSDGSYQEFHSA